MFLYEEFVQVFAFLLFKRWDFEKSIYLLHSVLVVAQGSLIAACGILVPWPVIEPMSSALQGGFLTTGSPGKSQI